MSTTPHPAACPYCGGTKVNQAQPDYMLRDVVLNEDGSITVGPVIDSVDFTDGSILFCHTCGSDYAQPAAVVEHFDDTLVTEYRDTSSRDDPAYVGARVRWVAINEAR